MLQAYATVDCDPVLQSTIQNKTVEFLKSNTEIFDNLDKLSLWNKISTIEYIKYVPELVKWTDSLSLKLREVSITVCNSKQDVPLHIDELPVTAKINFPILNTKDTYNCWYQVPEELLATVTPIINKFGNAYYDLENIDLDKCKLVGEVEVVKPVVFNSQIPHMIRMHSAKQFPRLVLSCTFFKEPIQSLL